MRKKESGAPAIKIKGKASKKKKAIIGTILVLVLAAAGTGGYMLYKKNTMMKQMQPGSSASQATAKAGDLSKTVVGTGNLETETAVSLKIPSGLTISQVNVESGDTVAKGDVLATVDHLSVLSAIYQTESEIETLENAVDDYDYDSSDTLNVLEYNIMKAKITAREETLETLNALSEDGDIVADRAGTISEVLVSEGNSSSSTSSTSTTSGSSSSSGSSSGGTQATNMSYQSGSIWGTGSSSSGLISLSATQTFVVEESTSSQETATTDAGQEEASTENAQEATSAEYVEVSQETAEATEEVTADSTTAKLALSIVGSGDSTVNALSIQQPETGGTPQTQINASDGSYTGSISWVAADQTFQEATTYQAMVTLFAGDGYVFGTDSIVQLSVGIVSGISVAEDGKSLSFTLTFPETIKADQTDDKGTNSGDTDGNTDANGNTDTNGTDTNASDNNSQTGTSQNASGSSDQSTSTSGTQSGSGTTTSTTSSDSDDDDTTEDTTDLVSQYSTDTSAFSISGNEEMTLAVNVDELDINSIEVGQEAEITFDAIEDETFTGTVTEIGNTATVSGGVAKYTVDITIAKADQMKVGMNASATIVIENRENVITIPVNALQEKGDEVFVYTSEDSEGNLSGEKTITTGLSDGDNVEVTEGLSEGDTVYYERTGQSSSSSDNSKQGMGGDMGGQMPSDFSGGGGGQMPSGGSGGGGMPGGMGQ